MALMFLQVDTGPEREKHRVVSDFWNDIFPSVDKRVLSDGCTEILCHQHTQGSQTVRNHTFPYFVFFYPRRANGVITSVSTPCVLPCH